MKKERPLNFADNTQIHLQWDIDINGRCIFLPGDSENSLITLSDLDTIVKGIHLLGDISQTEPIDILMTCAGGEDEIGLAIYDIIKSASMKTRIYCLGKCYSMATVILQAADERYAFPNTNFLIHEGTISTSGTYSSVKEEMKEMERLVELMYKVYSERTNLTRSKAKALCKDGKDYSFTAKEALELGFIDAITDKI